MFLTQSNACMSAMGSNSKHNKRSFAVKKSTCNYHVDECVGVL